MARRILALSVSLILLLAALTGCGAKQYGYEELTLTLPDGFQDLSRESYAEEFDFLFDNGIIAIAGIRETKQALAGFGVLDAAAYTQLAIDVNGLTCTPAQTEGIWHFSYDAVSNGTPLTYICAVYEAEDCFWQLQAYCAAADFAACGETMWKLVLSAEIS